MADRSFHRRTGESISTRRDRGRGRLKKGGVVLGRQPGIGDSWWSRRWNEVLESFGWGMACGGQVLDHQVTAGLVHARVQDTPPSPCRVTIRIRTLSGEEWERVINALAGRVVFATRLLAGEMPRDIEEAFREVRLSLFPAEGRDVESKCTCPDPANPCRHIAAVYRILGERFDADPFLVLKLRGMEREELLAALHERLAGCSAPATGREGETEDQPAIPPDPGLFWALDPVAVLLPLPLAVPGTEAALLRRLGPPPLWWDRVHPEDGLAQCYRTVAARARADLDKL